MLVPELRWVHVDPELLSKRIKEPQTRTLASSLLVPASSSICTLSHFHGSVLRTEPMLPNGHRADWHALHVRDKFEDYPLHGHLR